MSKLALAVLFGLLAFTTSTQGGIQSNTKYAEERYQKMREPRKYAFKGLN